MRKIRKEIVKFVKKIKIWLKLLLFERILSNSKKCIFMRSKKIKNGLNDKLVNILKELVSYKKLILGVFW